MSLSTVCSSASCMLSNSTGRLARVASRPETPRRRSDGVQQHRGEQAEQVLHDGDQPDGPGRVGQGGEEEAVADGAVHQRLHVVDEGEVRRPVAEDEPRREGDLHDHAQRGRDHERDQERAVLTQVH